jgi:hypothetical protein
VSLFEGRDSRLCDFDILRHGAAGYAQCADDHAVRTPERDAAAESREAPVRQLQALRRSALGKPLIAGFGERVVTEPVGGHGLASVSALKRAAWEVSASRTRRERVHRPARRREPESALRTEKRLWKGCNPPDRH